MRSDTDTSRNHREPERQDPNDPLYRAIMASAQSVARGPWYLRPAFMVKAELEASNPHGAIRSYNGILADSYRTGERYFVQEIVEPSIRTFDVTDQGALHERA